MSRSKAILAVLLLLVLGVLCYYMNKDSFTKPPIQISYRVSPWLKSATRGRARQTSDLGIPVVFTLDHYYKLTGLKVVDAEEIKTNKYAHPLWDVISDSNSIPTASFHYGERIRGLRPATKNGQPDPLQPYVMYRLILKTVDGEAEHDFTTTPPSQLSDQPPAK